MAHLKAARHLSAFFFLLGTSSLGCSSSEPGEHTGSGGDASSGGALEGAGGSPSGAGGSNSGGGGTNAAGGGPSGGAGNGENSGGAPSGGATGSGGADTLPPEAILFEEDFEAAANDSVPEGWNSFVSYVVDMNNTPGGSVFALTDSSKAHTGTKALHVKAGGQPAMLTRPLPEGTNRVYMRAYIWLTNKMGAIADNNHETLIGVRGTPGGANDEVRFGQIKGVLGTNEVPSDDISPTQESWGKGPEIAAGAWNCIEVAFLGDGANHAVHAWNNGTEVHVVDDPSQWNNKVLGPTFLDGKFKEFIIGWHSFSNYDNEIWVDDLVVATERVGCQ